MLTICGQAFQNETSHITLQESCSPHLAICSMLLSPRSHDKRVIDRNARDLLYTFTFQVIGLLHETREVSLEETCEIKCQMMQRSLSTRHNITSEQCELTLEQPGVKAPGTAKRTPFFPLKSWSIATLFPGSPSWTSTAGRCSPTWWGWQHLQGADFQMNYSGCDRHCLPPI